MAQSDYRFTGLDAVITFDDVVLSNDWTEFNYKEVTTLIDKAAGNERRTSYNVTMTDGDWDITMYDVAEQADALAHKLRGGVRGLLAVWAKGQVVGKPLMSFYGIISTLEKPMKRDDNVSIKVTGKQDGPFVQDIGSYAVA